MIGDKLREVASFAWCAWSANGIGRCLVPDGNRPIEFAWKVSASRLTIVVGDTLTVLRKNNALTCFDEVTPSPRSVRAVHPHVPETDNRIFAQQGAHLPRCYGLLRVSKDGLRFESSTHRFTLPSAEVQEIDLRGPIVETGQTSALLLHITTKAAGWPRLGVWPEDEDVRVWRELLRW